jgi:hypothetical protein
VPALSVAAVPNPDAKLLQLADEYFAVDAEWKRLNRIEERAAEKWNAENPIPDALWVQPEDEALGVPSPWRERSEDDRSRFEEEAKTNSAVKERFFTYNDHMLIEEIRGPKWYVLDEIEPPEGMVFYRCAGGEVCRYFEPSAAARARADEIVKAYDDWRPKRDRQSARIHRMEDKSDAVLTRAGRLLNKIGRLQAKTIEGLIAKAKVTVVEKYDDFHGVPNSIMRDLLALDGRAQS